MKTVISTPKAPAAIGPYSQAIDTGAFVFASGQVPLDPATGALIEGDAQAQAAQCCKNILAILEAADLTIENVVKSTVFITNMKDFPLVNEAYKATFKEPFPARSCVGVKELPLGALVEIEIIAQRS